MAVKEKMNFFEPNGRKFSKYAEGVDAAAAADYASAIAAITVGNLVSASLTSEIAGIDLPDVAGGSYSDATFHFRKGQDNVNVHFEQLANNLAEIIDANATGFVNLAEPTIINYAAKWSTAHGGGWALVEGRYVR